MPLLIECPLILQPLSIARHTRDLLSVVIRHRIRNTPPRGINPISLNPLIKLNLFLPHLLLLTPSNLPIENRCADDRPKEPTHTTTCKCNETKCDERIERNLGNERVHITTRKQRSTTDKPIYPSPDRRPELVETSRAPEFEERIPV